MPSELQERLQSALGSAYTLERELGGGGMARVFVATETSLSRRVVVKVLPPDHIGAVSAERFRREIQLSVRLRHPHIVPVHAASESDGLLFYTMPYVEGETLRAHLARNGAMPVDQAVRLLREVADALAYAHAQGVVHRDLKPENILIEHGHAVVADFGVAKALTASTLPGDGRLTSSGLAVGTPAYMSPEQALGDPSADHRSDLYALGCIAYEMLSGRPPFQEATAQALVADHLSRAPEPLAAVMPKIPPRLGALVMRLLDKRPEARPQSALEVVSELDLLPSHSEFDPSGPAKGVASGRKAAVAPAASIAVLLVIGAWLASRHDSGQKVSDDPRPSHSGAAAPITSIAVLPLVNESRDTTQEYLVDGMTDELTSVLGRVEGLRVASRTSAFAFKGRLDQDVRTIGHKLSVDAVLEGTIRRSGDRLRVTAQLTNASDGLAVWSESYERRLADVFAMQDEIAQAIVSALQPRIGSRQAGQPLGTVSASRRYDLDAYDTFLRAEFLYRRHTEPDLRRSIELYRQALARDSTLARAWVGIANAWAWLADDWIAPREAYPKAKQAVLRALAIDTTLADARSTVAIISAIYDRDFAAAAPVLKQALKAKPGQDVDYYDLGDLYAITGQLDSAIAAHHMGKQLNPLDPQASTRYGDVLCFAARCGEAMAQYRNALELEPNYTFALLGEGYAYVALGHPDSAIMALNEAPERTPRVRAATASAYAALGKASEARQIARDLEQMRRARYVQGDAIASIYGALGDFETAYRWLDVARAERSTGLLYLRVHPAFAPMRSDPRFAAYAERAAAP